MQFNGLEASLLLIAGFIGFFAAVTLLTWLLFFCLSRLGVGNR
jgi:hypothetical protein